jgi:HlyD family secretion protein
VELGQAIAELEPPRAALLDPRTRAEATELVRGAQAALDRAQQQVRAAEAAHELAVGERDRTERLVEAGARTPEALQRASADARRAEAELGAARDQVSAARAELRRARAAAESGEDARAITGTETLRAPAAGTVLVVHRESEGHVNAGEALVEIGDLSRLEIRSQVLSQDAARIRPGTRVIIERWGGEGALEAVVERIFPEGVTTVSALGVDEQRVTVVATPTEPAQAGIGSGYRVLARFVISETDDVLVVPESALFRTDRGWAVFAVAGGVAELRQVEINRRTGLAAEVVSGLTEGDEVIIYPAAEIEDGLRVERR